MEKLVKKLRVFLIIIFIVLMIVILFLIRQFRVIQGESETNEVKIKNDYEQQVKNTEKETENKSKETTEERDILQTPEERSCIC